jgi:chaperonin GroEL (HSP60 family)
MVQIAKAQDAETGDGTTSTVIIAGELLKSALELLQKKIHPTVISEGYKEAADEAIKTLEGLGIEIKPDEQDKLLHIAMTALNSKSVANARNLIATMARDSVLTITEYDGDVTKKIDIDQIKIMQKQGKSLADSQLIKGVIVDKEVLSPGMPKRIDNAKIALINANLEIEKTEFDAEIQITDPSKIDEFLASEEKYIENMVEKIAGTGANVVVCQKGVDDLATHFFMKKGIMAVRRVKKSDMEKLAKATNATIVTSFEDLTAESLGTSGEVYETKMEDDKHVFITKCPNPRAVTIILRGGSKYVTDEAERAIHDAICVVRDVLEDRQFVPGGGAMEVEVSKQLEKFAASFKEGRKGLVISKFAEAKSNSNNSC